MHVWLASLQQFTQQALSYTATCWSFHYCDMLLTVGLVKDTHSQRRDKFVFISAWLNGNDQNLKSNIIEQNNKRK